MCHRHPAGHVASSIYAPSRWVPQMRIKAHNSPFYFSFPFLSSSPTSCRPLGVLKTKTSSTLPAGHLSSLRQLPSMKIYADKKPSFQPVNLPPLLRNLMELYRHPHTPAICRSITHLAGISADVYYTFHDRLDKEKQKTIRVQLALDYLKSAFAATAAQASSGGGVQAQARSSSKTASPDGKLYHPHGSDEEQSLRKV